MAVYCPNCGKRLPDNAAFCDECGTRISAEVKKQTSFPKKALKAVLILAVLAAALFAGMTILESIYHRTPPEEPPNIPASVIPEETPSAPAETARPAVTPKPAASAAPQTVKPAVTVPEETPAADVPQGIQHPDGDPWFDEFLFYEEDVYYNGIPDDAVLQSAGYISGDWKYCMTFSRTSASEERIDEIGLAEVSFSADTATLILHPQYIRYGTDVTPEDEASVGYAPFTGPWDNEYIDVSANGIAIGLGPYYSWQGKDYVLGNIVVRETGMFGDVLLVRP